MTEQEKIEWLVSPGNLFPKDLLFGNLRGNKNFIEPFLEYSAILQDSQYWSEEIRHRIQLQRLKKLTSYLARNSKFWNNYFKKNNFNPDTVESLDDLRNLSILRRSDMLQFGEGAHVITDLNKDYIFSRNSSGTTGTPIKLLYDERERIYGTLAYQFRYSVFLDGNFLKSLLLRKFIVILGFPGQRFTFPKDFAYEGFKELTPTEIEEKDVREKIYDAIRQSAPTILIGSASLVLKLAQVVDEDGVSLPIFLTILSSEQISDESKLFIQKVFCAPIKNGYSSSGVGSIGFECDQQKGLFHLNAEQVIVEFIDPESRKVRGIDEEGEVVLTSLIYSVSPILRCAIDDIGNYVSGICMCKRTLPMFRFLGRRGGELILPSGKKIRSIHFHILLANSGVIRSSKQFQLIQENRESLRLLIIPRTQTLDLIAEARFRFALTKLFGGEKMNIEIDYVGEIPKKGRKPQFFIPLNSEK